MEEYVWISKMTAGMYFDRNCKSVLVRLARQYEVKITAAGSADMADEPYLQAIRDAADRKVAGIVVVGWEAAGLAEAINDAVAQGIPVVTGSADIPQCDRLAHIGTDWSRIGRNMADRMAGLIGGRGKVLAFFVSGILNSQVGLRGFREQMRDYPDIEVIGTEDDRGSDFEFSRQIAAEYLQKHQDLAGIVCLGNRSGVGSAMALTQAGKARDVKVICVGAEPEHLEHIRSGAIQATYYQRLDVLTCLIFQTIYAYNHGSADTGWQPGAINIIGNIDIGYTLVTQDNCDSFRSEADIENLIERHRLSRRVSLLTSMVENCSEMAFAIDRDGRITYANYAALRRSYHSLEQICERSIHDLFRLTDKQRSLVERCLREGKAASFDTQVVDRNGETFPVQLSLSALQTDGAPLAMSAVAMDLSERQKIEFDLRDERDRLRMIMDNASVGMCMTRHDPPMNRRTMVMCNDRYVAMSGRSRDELMEAEDLNEFVKVVKRDPASATIRQRGGLSSWIRPDGAENYFEWSSTTVGSEDGYFYGIGIDHDVTEKVINERELREQQQRLEMIMEHSHDGISLSVIDPKTDSRRLILCNDRYCQMTGLNRDELLEVEDLDELYVEIETTEPFRQAMAKGKACSGVHSWKRPDGRENYHEWTAVPFAQDGATHVIGVNRDVTDRTIAERELKKHQNRLEMIMAHSHDGINICHVSPETRKRRLVMCNDRFVEMSGHSRQELMDCDNLDELVTPVGPSPGSTLKLRLGETLQGLSTWKRPDGKENYYEWTAVRLDMEGMPHVIGVDRDVTDRIIAERQLRENQRRLEMIMTHSHDGINISRLDPETGRRWLVMCNDRYAEMSGRTRHELMGCDNLDDLVVSIKETPNFLDLMRKGERCVGLNSWKRPDGQENYHEWTAVPLNLEGALHVIGIDHDMTDRIRAERELRSVNERLHNTIRFSPDPTFAIDGRKRVMVWNRALEKMTGVNEDQIIGKDEYAKALVGRGQPLLIDLIGAEDPGFIEKVKAGYESFEQHGRNLSAHVYDPDALHGKGAHLWLAASPVMDDEGNLFGAIQTIRDVTALHEATEDIRSSREAERHFRQQLQRLHEVSTALDEAGTVRELFRLAVELGRERLGFDRLAIWLVDENEPHTLTGTFGTDEEGNLRDEWSQRHEARGYNPLTKVLAGKESVVFLENVPLNDHLRRQVGHGAQAAAALWDGQAIIGRVSTDNLLRGEPITQERLELLRLYAADIGHLYKRMRAEEEMRHQRDFATTLIEAAPVVILVLDADMRIVRMNTHAEEVTGYKMDEVLGKDWISVLVPGPDRGKVRDAFVAAISQSQMQGYANPIINRQGQLRDIEWYAKTISDPASSTVELLAVGLDVTDRKMVEEELRQAQKMEAVGRLAGGIAHDFNNQLTVIKGYGDLLLRELQKDDPVYSQVEEMYKAAGQAEALTSQLLSFSRKQILNPQVVNLNDILAEMADALGHMVGDRAELSLKLSEGLGNVEADPTQVQQAIMNLVVNAWDALSEGGRIEIRTRNVTLSQAYVQQHADAQAGPHIALSISDTGLGMDAGTMARVFEPFFTTKPVGQGTGLGLPMVYGFVKQSGGHIGLTSKPGAGTTFRIYLPRVEADTEPRVPAAPASAGFEGTETILVAEDEESVRRLIVRLLRRDGYTVLEAADGHQALLLGKDCPGSIDLLITDVVMPGMGGTKLASELRKIHPDISVLFITGYTERVSFAQGLEHGTELLLTKPFQPSKLGQAVRSLLDARIGRKTGEKPS